MMRTMSTKIESEIVADRVAAGEGVSRRYRLSVQSD